MKQVQSYDLVFVGNGSIATLAALRAKQRNPSISIAVIGDPNQSHSATLAAGAMHAVYCEIEESFQTNANERFIFELGLRARNLFHNFVEEFDMRDVITAQSTVMYKRKNGSEFEKNNFDLACSIAENNGVLSDVSVHEQRRIFQGSLLAEEVEAKRFTDEISFDARQFLVLAAKIARDLGVIFIDGLVNNVCDNGNNVSISTQSSGYVYAQKAVIAAGSQTSKVIDQKYKLVPICAGVGTAFLFDNIPGECPELREVVRTPNRGGAQCGLHLVPVSDGRAYLGAGNYLSTKAPTHRLETMRYLINLCETELLGREVIYKTTSQICLGARPRSFDGLPLLGTGSDYKNIFVASGNYRVGLTLSPLIADLVTNWLDGKGLGEDFSSWRPDRSLRSYSSMGDAVEYFSSSRVSNLLEHGLICDSQTAIREKKKELADYFIERNKLIINQHRLDESFVSDPDMHEILLEHPSLGC